MKKVTFIFSNIKSAFKQLNSVTKGQNSLLSITQATKIEVVNNIATFNVTNLETALTITCKCESDTNFTMCIPVQQINDIINNALDAPIDFIYEEAKKIVHIETALGKITLPTEEPKDFPNLPTPELTATFPIHKDVYNLLKRATNFCSNDTLRPAMTGVCLHLVDDGNMYIVSTDAHTLYRSDKIQIDYKNTSPESYVIPKNSIEKMLTNSIPETTTIKLSTSHIFFCSENYTYSIRLIDANYPDYRAIIPEYTAFLKVSNTELSNALRFTQSCSNKSTYQTIFDISEKTIKISTSDIDEGKDAKSSIPLIDKNCTPFKFALNSKILLNCLNQLEDEITFLTSETATRAFIIKHNDTEELALIMPLMTTDIQ